MSIANLGSRLIECISRQTGLEVNIDSTIESLGMDSLDNIECIMAIEEEFDIEIEDEVYLGFDSVLSVLTYIYNLEK